MTGIHDKDEPLSVSAPLAHQVAGEFCQVHGDGKSCRWSHGLWQYLRLLGLVTGASRHAEFFRSAFSAVVGDAPRVLISGAADYAMLVQVLGAFGARNVQPSITVVDRCETPLWLNRWLADRAGWKIETHKVDILSYSDPQPFDLVCTHAFLGYFSPAERPALFAKWRSLLSERGRIVTVNRVEDGPGPKSRFSDEQARAFCVQVVQRATAAPREWGLNVEALRSEAENYAANAEFWRLRSREDLVGLIDAAGLAVEKLDLGQVAASASSGPTTPGNAWFAQVIARGK
jgi:hypothetical protein